MSSEKLKKSNFVPGLIIPDVSRLSAELLNRHGIKALILDVDNTLTTHGSQEVSKKVGVWLEAIKKINIPAVIVSNNTRKRIEPFARLLKLPFVSMGLKPMIRGFKKAQRLLGVEKTSVAVVGDQIFTDIWGGNRAGMFTVLVTPMQLEASLGFRFRRSLEKGYIKRYHDDKNNK